MDNMDNMCPSAKMRKLTSEMSGSGATNDLVVPDYLLDVMKDVRIFNSSLSASVFLIYYVLFFCSLPDLFVSH